MTIKVGEITLIPNRVEYSEDATRSGERVIIERAKAGDAAAFEHLLVCHQRKVVATAWRMLGNEEDARDAAQEAFLKAFKYLKSYKPDQDFAGWLYRITVNACRDIARKRGSAEQFTSFESEQELGRFAMLSSNENVEAAAIAAQERAMIEEALRTLTEKERAAIVLRDLEGLTTEEVAGVLGSSPTTVRSQISSARVKIKKFRDRYLQRHQ